MTTHHFNETGSEFVETPALTSGRHIETLDDIPREIADRRLHAEFGADIATERSDLLHERPDVLESPADFIQSAKAAGLADSEGVLGWSTRLEDSAHVLKGDVSQEIATLIHEDLHRATHSETLREIGNDPALRDLYEGITEHFTERAAAGLHGFETGEVYAEQVEGARRLVGEMGDQALRDWFFKNEVSDELKRTLEQFFPSLETRV